MAMRQICTFRVDGMSLGLDVEYVQEVLRHQEMTEVPLAPPAVKGLINLRGQIVTALDMRRRFELPPDTSGEPPMNVIMQTGGSLVSLLVDSIGEVESVNDDWYEPVPETLDMSTKSMVRYVCKLESKLLLILEPRGVLEGVARTADAASAVRENHGN
jgi:purine-binding chemotaxis protein CheW